MMKATPPNKNQTKATPIPSGMSTRRLAGSPVSVQKRGTTAGQKRAPGTYDNTNRFTGNKGTGTGKGRTNYKRS